MFQNVRTFSSLPAESLPHPLTDAWKSLKGAEHFIL
jgi:hypothetical protein